MSSFNDALTLINQVLWHDTVLFALVVTGVVFSLWSRFSQFQSLTHGIRVIAGRYDSPGAPGAISHFQALSAALSSTVGLGNIGGVALAISLGGPGAVLWMWVIGFVGMAIKTSEVTLSMLYRNTDDPGNPHGGPMWVLARGFQGRGPTIALLAKVLAVLFCLSLLLATTMGGNIFQAWNVSEMTRSYFGIPPLWSGLVLATAVALVIIGGIRRIGSVAGRLVPAMVGLYLLGGSYVLYENSDQILPMFGLILSSAFSPTEASGAFIGGTVGNAFLFGMKRAVFSSEVGQGSSPIAHCAVKTDEPVREGVVAGLEPLVDTLVVCTFTALVLLSTGIWNRSAEAQLQEPLTVTPCAVANCWQAAPVPVPPRLASRQVGERVYMVVEAHPNPLSGNRLHRLNGEVADVGDGNREIHWLPFHSPEPPLVRHEDLYVSYVGALLTAKAFDSALPGLGKWLITTAVWLFALSTMLSASYFGEQAIVFLFGNRYVPYYKTLFCGLTVVACTGFIHTDAQLDNLTGLGNGLMLATNLPILWLFSRQTMRAYREYIGRMAASTNTALKASPLK